MSSGSASSRARVSTTASWIVRGRAARSCCARWVRSSLGKAEVSPDLVEGLHSARLYVLFALAQSAEETLVLEDLQGLLEDLLLVRRHKHCDRSAAPGDHHVLVALVQFVQELAQLRPSLSETYHLLHSSDCTGICTDEQVPKSG